jgi:hypothetical protein
MKTMIITIMLFISISSFAREFSDSEKLEAIKMRETTGGTNLCNPAEPNAVGILQIYPIMVKDVNRILGYEKYQMSDRQSEKMSIEMFWIYQNRYNPSHDFEKMCRIWSGGPKGMKKQSTIMYYQLALNNLCEVTVPGKYLAEEDTWSCSCIDCGAHQPGMELRFTCVYCSGRCVCMKRPKIRL